MGFATGVAVAAGPAGVAVLAGWVLAATVAVTGTAVAGAARLGTAVAALVGRLVLVTTAEAAGAEEGAFAVAGAQAAAVTASASRPARILTVLLRITSSPCCAGANGRLTL